MLKRILALITVAGVGFGILAGCDDTPEQERSVVTVSMVNEGVPVISDVLEQGDSLYRQDGTPVTNDDFIAPDWVIFQFQNRPYDSGIIATGKDQPFNDFIITRYEIVWTRVDGGAPALPPYVGNTNISVPSGDKVEAAILLVNFNNKTEPFLVALQYGGSPPEVLMRADIRFFGHESGTDRETEVHSQVSVSFADLIIATSDKKDT